MNNGFKEMPGVGEYCPEPAAATIHAAPPPHAESIKINEIDVCRQVINRHGMPAHKIGRLWKFKKDQVDKWVESGGAETSSSADTGEKTDE